MLRPALPCDHVRPWAALQAAARRGRGLPALRGRKSGPPVAPAAQVSGPEASHKVLSAGPWRSAPALLTRFEAGWRARCIWHVL